MYVFFFVFVFLLGFSASSGKTMSFSSAFRIVFFFSKIFLNV